ncbi:hypothetical protein Tco_1014591 [Tanacetum coccineum]
MKETVSIRRIQRRPIRRIGDKKCEDSGRYQAWSLLQETLIRRAFQTPGVPQMKCVRWPCMYQNLDREVQSQ